jgi:diguanylate cyclase
MRHETVSSLRKNMTFGIIILDIDFFKKINDTYGHDGGDCVLSQLAEILIESVRAGDFIFRLGGEEFLIVIADVKPNIIYNIAESIRTNVSNKEFLLTDNRTLKVTVSIGTAIHDGHPDFNRTIKLADTALYQAKQNGRNKVVSISQYAKAS